MGRSSKAARMRLCASLTLDAVRRAHRAAEHFQMANPDYFTLHVCVMNADQLEEADPLMLPFVGVHITDQGGNRSLAVLNPQLTAMDMIEAIKLKAEILQTNHPDGAAEREPWEADPDAWRGN